MISIIHALVYIEVQSNEKSMVRPTLERALKHIRTAGVEILNSNIEDVMEEEEGIYTSVLEAEIKTDLK